MADQLIKNLINHKDFYGHGYYHKAIYHGAELIWEKSAEQVALLAEITDISNYDYFLYIIKTGGTGQLILQHKYLTLMATSVFSYYIPMGIGVVSTNSAYSDYGENLPIFLSNNEVLYSSPNHLNYIKYTYESATEFAKTAEAILMYGDYFVNLADFGDEKRSGTLSNGITYIAGNRVVPQARYDQTNNYYVRGGYRCYDNNLDGTYVIGQADGAVKYYSYVGFATNDEQNRLFGWRIDADISGSDYAGENATYKTSIVELEYSDNAPTQNDELVVKNVLWENSGLVNSPDSSKGWSSIITTQTDLWVCNNVIFFYVFETNKYDGDIHYVNIDTLEHGIVADGSDMVLYPQGIHYYNGMYYIIALRNRVYRVVKSKDLVSWKLEDTVLEIKGTIFSCVFEEEYAYVYSQYTTGYVYKITL